MPKVPSTVAESEVTYSEIQKLSARISFKFDARFTWILPGIPVESILEAILTALPQTSYNGLLDPTTPAITLPCEIPGNETKMGD